MTRISIRGTDEALEYFEEIVGEMLAHFPVSHSEAVARLNRFWSGQDFIDELDVNLLRHEDPEFWAKTIYYGRETPWWNGEEGLGPEPYP